MKQAIDQEDILFLDIETVPLKSHFSQLNSIERSLWLEKAAFINKKGISDAEFYHRAGIYAEFGKIVCISVGKLVREYDGSTVFLESFASHNERRLLSDFSAFLDELDHKGLLLCAHNGKEFDFPYIARRCLIRNVPLPGILNIAGKKPWEVQHLDTLELWKFGDWKSYTSLKLLAHGFGIANPKEEMDGSDVWRVYWEENDLDKIVRYCESDVITLMEVYRRMKGQKTLGLSIRQHQGAA
jgi:uncharacterized protein YprB with RNaseH-like and TPR domain